MAFNVAPTSFTPTATTAPTGSTGLGGLFNAGIAGLATATDYIVQSYQVPAGTAVIPGRSLFITGVRINSVNLGATSAGALVWVYALQFGSTGVAPNGTEGATVKAGRRIVIGQQSLASGSAAGIVASPDLSYSFQTPIMVQPGEYIQTIMRFWAYTTAASETLGISILYDGYWE